MKPPKIKTIIEPRQKLYAAFAPSYEDEIDQRIERVICLSLVEFPEPDVPDEVIGQIIVDGKTITEVTSVDEEEGYGEFVGYFLSPDAAQEAIENWIAETKKAMRRKRTRKRMRKI